MTMPDDAVVLLPGEAPAAPGLRGGVTRRLANAGDTADAYALAESTALPGTPGAPPHIHHEGEEAFYVLEGELRFHIGDHAVTTPAGSFVLVPRGVAHAFANAGSEIARYLVLYSPPRVGAYFEELAALARQGRTLDRETIAAVALRYGTEYIDEAVQ